MDRVIRGNGFRGVFNYNLASGKGQVIGGTTVSDNATDLAREMRAVASLRDDIEKPVWHFSLRLPKGEKITPEKFEEIGSAFMQKMGLDKHQHTFILDDMKSGQHLHIVANRIALDGSVYHGKNENLKATRYIGELEKEFGLQQTKQAASSQKRAKAKPKKNEIEQALRTGHQPPKLQIQQVIDHVLDGSAYNLSQFEAELFDFGVQSRRSENKTGLVGYSFSLDGNVWFKGSQLGKKYSKQKLVERGLHEQIGYSEAVTDQTNTNATSTRKPEQGIKKPDSKFGVAESAINDIDEWNDQRNKEPNREPDQRTDQRNKKSNREPDQRTKRCGENAIEKWFKPVSKAQQHQDRRNEEHAIGYAKQAQRTSSIASIAFHFFATDFIANCRFASFVRYHNPKTKETKLDTGYSKGTVQSTESRAFTKGNSAEHNADLLLHYAQLRCWKEIKTGSSNPEFLYHLENQALRMQPPINLSLTDEQIAKIDDYRHFLDGGLGW